jgi:hypothetical protein
MHANANFFVRNLGQARKIGTGAFSVEAVRCIFPVGREFKMEIRARDLEEA